MGGGAGGPCTQMVTFPKGNNGIKKFLHGKDNERSQIAPLLSSSESAPDPPYCLNVQYSIICIFHNSVLDFMCT